MTTPSETHTAPAMVVSCATCDSVFRAHPDRQTCPCCGGAPGVLIWELTALASPASADAPGSDPEAETPLAPALESPTQASPPAEGESGAGDAEGAPADDQAAGAGAVGPADGPLAERSEPEAAEEAS